MILLTAAAAWAQRPTPSPQNPPPAPPPAPAPCPAIQLTGPKGPIGPGETLRYSTRVDQQGTGYYIEFKWTTNPAGINFAGQGGPEIEFERPAGNRNSVMVTVEVMGLPAHCPRTASEGTSWTPTPQPRMLDQFLGPLTTITDQRMRRITSSLRGQPGAMLFVVLEYDLDTGEAAAKQKGTLVASLLKKALVDDKSVSYALGKTSRERVQFWLVPQGAEYPKLEK